MTEEFKPFVLTIEWSIDDIKDRRPNWSDEKCNQVLSDLAGYLEDESINAGWEVIDNCLWEYDEEEEEEEDA